MIKKKKKNLPNTKANKEKGSGHKIPKIETKLVEWGKTRFRKLEQFAQSYPESLLLHGNRFPVAQMVKHLPCNVGDPGSIPGSGRSPGEEWQPTPVPWMEEPGGLQSMELQRVGHD